MQQEEMGVGSVQKEAEKGEKVGGFRDVLEKVGRVIGGLGSEGWGNKAAEVWNKVADVRNEVVEAVVNRKNEITVGVDDKCGRAFTRIGEAARSAVNEAKGLFTETKQVAGDLVAPIRESVNGKINRIKTDAVDAVHEVGMLVNVFAGEGVLGGGLSVGGKTIGELISRVRGDVLALMEEKNGVLLEKAMGVLHSRIYDAGKKASLVAGFGDSLRNAAAQIRQSRQEQTG